MLNKAPALLATGNGANIHPAIDRVYVLGKRALEYATLNKGVHAINVGQCVALSPVREEDTCSAAIYARTTLG